MLPYPYPPVFRLRTCTIKNRKQPKFCIRMKAIEYGSNRFGSGRLQAVPVEIFFLIFGADKQKKQNSNNKNKTAPLSDFADFERTWIQKRNTDPDPEGHRKRIQYWSASEALFLLKPLDFFRNCL